MGDHRANVKIEFDFHGKTYRTEMNINWSPDDFEGGIDRRVVEWFKEAADEGYSRFGEEMAELHKAEREADTERTERAQLAALKAKYEVGQATQTQTESTKEKL